MALSILALQDRKSIHFGVSLLVIRYTEDEDSRGLRTPDASHWVAELWFAH